MADLPLENISPKTPLAVFWLIAPLATMTNSSASDSGLTRAPTISVLAWLSRPNSSPVIQFEIIFGDTAAPEAPSALICVAAVTVRSK